VMSENLRDSSNIKLKESKPPTNGLNELSFENKALGDSPPNRNI
jgi:hypothetical protein